MRLNTNQAVINITSLQHFKEIINGEKEKSVIVDFWASWCGPCRVISPYFQKLAIQAPDNVRLYKINIDEVVDAAREFKIKAIPTFMCFKGGKKVAEVTGADRVAVEALVSQAGQDDDDLKIDESIKLKVAEVTNVDDVVVDDPDELLFQAAQDDDLKMEKQPSEFKM